MLLITIFVALASALDVATLAADAAIDCEGGSAVSACKARITAPGIFPAEQAMLHQACVTPGARSCEEAWIKIFEARSRWPRGLVGLVPEGASRQTTPSPSLPAGRQGSEMKGEIAAVTTEAKATVTIETSLVAEEVEVDPCRTPFAPEYGKLYVGAIRGNDGRSCYGAGLTASRDTAVLRNNGHDPSLMIAHAISRQEEDARTSAYVVLLDGDVQEAVMQSGPGRALIDSLIEVVGVPPSVLGHISHRSRVSPGGSLLPMDSPRGLPLVSAMVGYTQGRVLLPSASGRFELHKFARASNDTWVYVGSTTSAYDWTRGAVTELFPIITSWRR